METDRIMLRHWLDSDSDALFKYASHPDVGPRAGWEPHKTVEESLNVIRKVFDNPTTWAIVLKETSEPIGAVGYGASCECSLPSRPDEPTVGYWLGRPYWNKGICTEALRLMMEHIRRTTDIKSLVSGHFTDNPASGAVMEKCGFKPTGDTVFDDTLYAGSRRPIRVLRCELRNGADEK
ncbi:MAG: GNAT family N-acetyltransferase [Prevotella sp.]